MKQYLKKACALFVAVIMTATLLVGCGGGNANTGENTDVTENTTTSVSPSSGTVADERMKITMAMWELTEVGGDAVGDALEDKLNVDIEAILLDADWMEKVKLWAASDDLPDCIGSITVADAKSFYSWIDQGLVRSIPSALIDKYEFTKSKMTGNAILDLTRKVTGDTYYIPRPDSPTNLYTAHQQYLFYRKDWLEKVGITKVPESIDELYDALKKFTTDDPDGNSKNDTYGLTGNYTFLYDAFDAHPTTWVKEDGKSIPGYLSNKMVDALKWFRKLYSEKILDPELSAIDEKFSQGNFGAYLHGACGYWTDRIIMQQFGEANPDLGNPLDIVGLMGPFSKTPGGEKIAAPMVQISGTVINADVSDEKLDKILEIDNYLMSPEGNDLRYWGIKDVDYSIDGSGNYKRLNDDVLRTKYPSIYIQNWPTWDLEWNVDMSPSGNPAISKEVKQLANEARERYNAAYNPDTSVIDFTGAYIWTPARDKYNFDYSTALVNIITGSDDVEAMFNKMVEDAYAAGVQSVIDEANEFTK